MSLGRKLRGAGGGALVVVSGTLTGSGNLTIPIGVTSISLTGRGANGTNNYHSDPGQPYIAPTTSTSTNTHGQYQSWLDSAGTGPDCSDTPGSTGPTNVRHSTVSGKDYVSWDCPLTKVTNPGQPYVPPSSGGGPQYGASTTATLNGTTATFQGGYDANVVATPSTQSLSSTGNGQTMSYIVQSTGALSYSYSYIP